MLKKTIFYSFLCTSLIPIISAFSTISCSKTENNTNDNYYPDIPEIEEPILPSEPSDEEITNNDLKTEIVWLESFNDQKKNFYEMFENFIFAINEKIYENDEYLLEYIGNVNNVPCYSIKIKEINKFYICSVAASYDKLSNKYTKPRIKDFIFEEVKKSFEKDMKENHEIEDDDLFVLLDPSDFSISFDINENLNFLSSWGVNNSQSKSIVFNININVEKIKQMLFGNHFNRYDNFKINQIKFTDLFILPRTIIWNEPINYIDFKINSIKNMNEDKFLVLTNDEKNSINLEIPGKNNKKQYWTGTVLNKTLSGYIVQNEFSNGLSSSLANFVNVYNKDNPNLIDRINSSNKDQIEEHFNKIKNNAKKFSINITDNNLSLKINSTIKGGANSANLFGDRTEGGIYNIECIQKIKLSFTEYKKI